MARKTLLTESEIRRFMKLANMGPIGAGRLQEMYPPAQRDDEVMGDEEMGMDVEAAPEEEPLGDEEMGLEDEEMGLEDEEGLEGLEDEGAEELAPDAVAAVEDALETMLDAMGGALEPYGVVMDAERTEGDEEEMEGEMDLGGEPPIEVPEEPIPGEEEEGAMAPSPEMGEEEMVAEVARRVAARLMKESRKEKMAEQLTERIFKRLLSK